MKKNNSTLKNIFFKVVPLQFKSTPVLDTIVIMLGIVLGLLLTLNVVAMQQLFDRVVEVVANKGEEWDCFISLLILASTTMGVEIIQGIFDFMGEVIFKKSAGKILIKMFKKIQNIDSTQFENPEFLNDLNKAREGVIAIPYFCMSMYILVSFYLVYFISQGGYLFSLKPILLITIFLSFIPALIGQFLRLHVYSRLEQESAPIRRTCDYYQRTLCDREFYKETRMLGAFEYFYKLFTEALVLFSKKQWSTEKKATLLQLSMNMTSFLGMGIATLILFDATFSGEISVGAFAAVFTSLRTIFSLMQQIIGGHLSNLNQNVGKVNNFITLLDMPSMNGESEEPVMAEGITLDNVSFNYCGREIPAIKELSLSIGSKETIAIVGENGAGKSTLVRLLTGIYRPTKGSILIGGLDTSKTEPSKIYEKISGVFQKVQKYKMTLQENVVLGVPSELDSEVSIEKINDMLNEAGFEKGEIKMNTMLSPEYGGVDISGGQWQRLAIARGLYRESEIIVLDEPTSAVDPIEETRMYMQFQKMAQEKCAVIVTHRLGSAKLADRIVVMESGQIVDVGTHNELINREGVYAKMYAEQAKWYDRVDEEIIAK